MKKNLFTAFIILACTGAFAQKPVAGNKTAEVNLFFITGSAPIQYNAPELRFRYFNSDNTAFRLRIGMNSTTNKFAFNNAAGDVTAEVTSKSGFALTLSPGYEKHFAGTSKLSPFIGGQLGISLGGANSVEVTNSGYASGNINITKGDSYSSKSGSTFGLNLGLYMGADYYIAQHIFIGGEFGLGLFGMSSTGEGEEKYVRDGDPMVTKKTPKSSSSSLFGVTSGGVRLGFVF